MNHEAIQARLIHAATAYDRRSAGSKWHNPYALAQYFTAIDRAMALIVAGIEPRKAVLRCFNDRLLDALLKALDQLPSTQDERDDALLDELRA